MDSNIKKLVYKFNEISCKRWIKGVNNDVSGVGLTFEKELNKEIDSELFPDFYNIEIKCSQRYSNFPMTLFNKALEGPRLFETNYIVENYGKKYFENSKRKGLFVNFVYNEMVLVNDSYYFKLFLSFEDKKMYFQIFDLDKKLLDTSYINFSTIEEHLKIKLSNLALVYASKTKFGDNNYFRYYLLNYYKLKSINIFYELIKSGVIKVSLMCRASFSKKENGSQKNKGINFKIDKNNIEELFDKVFEYNRDKRNISINSEFIFDDLDILSLGDLFEEKEHLGE